MYHAGHIEGIDSSREYSSLVSHVDRSYGARSRREMEGHLMRGSRHPNRPATMHDPLGIIAHSATADRDVPREDRPDKKERAVNPLWMITAGLALFVLLLVAVG